MTGLLYTGMCSVGCRAGRRRVQPAVGDARVHADVPPVEGGQAAAVHAAQRVPHVRHAALVDHRQRCVMQYALGGGQGGNGLGPRTSNKNITFLWQ